MHRQSMRRLVPAFTLALAACAPRPQQLPPTPQPVVAAPASQVRSGILGATASELVSLFGNPALQVREGVGLKMQFRRRNCVLDAYLYAPPTGGVQRVTYVNTRYQSGADADQPTCVRLLRAP